VVEVGVVAEAGEGAQVDVDVHPDAGAGAGAPSGSPAFAALGPLESAAEHGEVVSGIGVVVGEVFVEVVGG